MNLKDNLTSQSEYDRLSCSDNLSPNDVYKMARYPYLSLVDLCGSLSNSEYNEIKRIEDLNIFYFLNTLKIVCGLGTTEEQATFRRALSEEPLRTAVILGRSEQNLKEGFISFVTNAMRILLSPKPKYNQFFNDPINVAIVGQMPRNFLKSRQEIGNSWYSNFVELKLNLISKTCHVLGETKVFPILLMSTAYSLYKFTPNRYAVSDYFSEDDNLHRVINTFFSIIEQIRK